MVSSRLVGSHSKDATLPIASQQGVSIAMGLAESEPEVLLMLYHRKGVVSAPLSEGRSVVVGRQQPSQIVVDDASLSRQHARFTLQADVIHIEDLESTNGTSIAGKRVDRGQIRAGGALRLGGVHCVTYKRAPHEAGPAGILGHEPFMMALDRGVAGARYFGDGASVLLVRGSNEEGAAHVSSWLGSIRRLLRPVDAIGLYGPNIAEVFLPRCSAERAASFADKIAGASHNGAKVVCGVASFPDDGAAGAELLERARDRLRSTSKAPPGGGHVSAASMIIHSEAMKKQMKRLDRIAAANLPVLLLGETGVGKEVVARAIHAGGRRSDGPFVAVNCGAIPRQLLESTLFGHERGAFTGASAESPGVFGSADGGTVLLDEIGELPLDAQAALLRTLETGTVTRVGSADARQVDVRVIAATHRDLEGMVAANTFREDLLYRINALILAIPPLRERHEAIAPLAQRFLSGASEAVGSHPVGGIADEAMRALREYRWPGNIRELRNVIERACVIAEADVITVEDLPDRVRGAGGGSGGGAGATSGSAPPAAGEVGAGGLREQVRNFERNLIVAALRANNGNQTHAAKGPRRAPSNAHPQDEDPGHQQVRHRVIEVSEEQVLYFRAVRGHMAGPGAKDAVVAARDIIGAQAQAVGTGILALSQRTKGRPSAKKIQAMFGGKNRKLVRIWGQRGTMHMYAPDDWRTIIAAFAEWAPTQRRGPMPSDATLDKALAVITERASATRKDIIDIAPRALPAHTRESPYQVSQRPRDDPQVPPPAGSCTACACAVTVASARKSARNRPTPRKAHGSPSSHGRSSRAGLPASP